MHVHSIFRHLSFFSLLLFFSCSETDKTAAPPSGADPSAAVVEADSSAYFASTRSFNYSFADESKKYKVPAKSEENIHLPSGTSIHIPAGCFVDDKGKPVSGTVDVVVEEFLSAGSIIASQINMHYDSAGTSFDFESAGMFRIQAYQDSRPVFIAKNRSIAVSLATTDTDKGFNIYYSTANGDDWAYLGASTPVENTDRAARIRNAQSRGALPPPIRPTAYSANGDYFDLNLSHIYTRNLNSLLGLVWEYAGQDPKKDPATNKDIFNRNWDEVHIYPQEGAKRGLYNIVLQKKDSTLSIPARPVYRGAVLDAENEQFQEELGEFNQRMTLLKNEEQQARTEASFLRAIEVKNLGLYNYDRQYHSDGMIPIYARFDFGADSLKNYPITVYLVTGNGMAVIRYPIHDWDKFRYSRQEKNKLIAILPNQEICTFSSGRFEKEAPASPGRFTFTLSRTGLKASDSKSIDQVLRTI